MCNKRECFSMAKFVASPGMGYRKSRFFSPCWPMSDGFQAASWIAAQGRLPANANDRWRETQPCSVDVASGNGCLRRQQTLGTEARTTTTGRQRLSMHCVADI